MIPAESGFLNEDFEIEEESGYTFWVDTVANTIYRFTDDLEAVKQAIYIILGVERYQHVIFTSNFGVELADLIGEPISYVLPEIPRRITDALTQDQRILNVTGFEFKTEKKIVTVTFTVETVYGDILAEKAVSI